MHVMRSLVRWIGLWTAALTAVAALAVLGTAQTAVNQPPMPRVSVYKVEDAGDSTVVLDASGSTDPDGQILRYQWVFGDGETGSGAEVRHTYPRADVYTVTLLVGDDRGAAQLLTQTIDISRLPLGAVPEAPRTPQAMSAAVASNLPVGTGIGQRAPEIELPDLHDGMARLSDHLGRVVIVEFWLSTCPGCRASTPHLEELRKAYADRGLDVLLVILDRTASDASAFLDSYGFSEFFTAWEARASERPTMHSYGVSTVPHAFLVDRTGAIRYTGHPVGLTADIVEAWI
jgi:thiol-disulfide isomerase/thioredoxin